MSDFDYINTRLRAMQAGLLTPAALTRLAESPSLAQFLNGLGQTTYGSALAAARARYSDQIALGQALQAQMSNTIAHIQQFSRPSGKALAADLDLIWAQYDVQNLIAIERGLRQSLPPDTILAALIGGGRLPPGALRKLAEAPSARAARDLMVTWGDPLARPLLALGEKAASLAAVEVALAQWYFEQRTAPAGRHSAIMAELARREADLANIMTVLRRLATGAAPPENVEWPAIFIGPGTLAWARLAQIHAAPHIPAAIAALAQTRVGRPLKLLPTDPNGRRLSHFSGQLRRANLRWLGQIRLQDPFGPGILLAYLAHKEHEISRLRRIGSGLWLGEPAAAILTELDLL